MTDEAREATRLDQHGVTARSRRVNYGRIRHRVIAFLVLAPRSHPARRGVNDQCAHSQMSDWETCRCGDP